MVFFRQTFVCNTLITVLRGHGLKVAAAAWTGIAAQLLEGGQTIHSLFKLPVPVTETSTANLTASSDRAEYFRRLSLIILDEASKIPAHALRAIELLLRDIGDRSQPFRRKVIVLGGDFRQASCRAARKQIADSRIFSEVIPLVAHGEKVSANPKHARERRRRGVFPLAFGDRKRPATVRSQPG